MPAPTPEPSVTTVAAAQASASDPRDSEGIAPPPHAESPREEVRLPMQPPTVSPQPAPPGPANAPESAAAPAVQRVSPSGLPEVTVVRTAWHPKPDRRSAKLRIGADRELLSVHEGDSVSGLVLREITPSSVVFGAGDIEFRRRVGESAPSR